MSENIDLIAPVMEKLSHPEIDHADATSLFHMLAGRRLDITEKERGDFGVSPQLQPISDTKGEEDILDDVREIYDFVSRHPDLVAPMVKELAEEDPDMTEEEAAELYRLLSSVQWQNGGVDDDGEVAPIIDELVAEDADMIYDFLSEHPDLVAPIIDELVAEDPDMTQEDVAELLKFLHGLGSPDFDGVYGAHRGSASAGPRTEDSPEFLCFHILCGLISEHPGLIPTLIQDLRDIGCIDVNLETVLRQLIRQYQEWTTADTGWKGHVQL
jgi:hypothetical protein